jgi:hypothetical protein
MRLAAAMLIVTPLAARASQPARAEAPLWLVVEGLYGSPGNDGSRGPGAAVRAGIRFTDQVSSAIGFETLFARGGPVTGLSAGFEAMLDSTPLAPFFELSVVRTNPSSRVGYTLAQRTGFGADFRVSKTVALGAVVRYFQPLDNDAPLGGTALAGLEMGLRLVLTASIF